MVGFSWRRGSPGAGRERGLCARTRSAPRKERPSLPSFTLDDERNQVETVLLHSPHAPAKVLAILQREMDGFPSVLRSLLSLNAHHFRGTSPVCGRVLDGGFELRNQMGPSLSLRALGSVHAADGGSRIVLTMRRPLVPDLVGIVTGRYARDAQVILAFLERTVGAVAPGGPRTPGPPRVPPPPGSP